MSIQNHIQHISNFIYFSSNYIHLISNFRSTRNLCATSAGSLMFCFNGVIHLRHLLICNRMIQTF